MTPTVSGGLSISNVDTLVDVMESHLRNGMTCTWMNFIRNVPRLILEKLITIFGMALPADGFLT